MTADETRAVLSAIKTRRSFRKYKSTPVPQALINQVIEAGTYAASGKSQQPWRVIVVTNEAVKARLRHINAQIMGASADADPFYGAPVYLIVIADRTNPNAVYDGTLMMGNMMLAAHVLGLGSCWINRAQQEFEQPEWKEWLKSIGVDGDYEGIAHLALGYPDETPRPAKPRKECVIKVP